MTKQSNESKDSIQIQLKVAQDQISKINRNFSDSRSPGETWKGLYEEQTQTLMDQIARSQQKYLQKGHLLWKSAIICNLFRASLAMKMVSMETS